MTWSIMRKIRVPIFKVNVTMQAEILYIKYILLPYQYHLYFWTFCNQTWYSACGHFGLLSSRPRSQWGLKLQRIYYIEPDKHRGGLSYLATLIRWQKPCLQRVVGQLVCSGSYVLYLRNVTHTSRWRVMVQAAQWRASVAFYRPLQQPDRWEWLQGRASGDYTRLHPGLLAGFLFPYSSSSIACLHRRGRCDTSVCRPWPFF